MEEKILNIVSSCVGTSVEELKKHMDVECIWDSLQKIEMIITIEEEFDISFTPQELAEINTISQIISKVQRKIQV